MTGDRPGLRGTSPGDLATVLVVIAVACYVLLHVGYDSIPQLQYVTTVPLAALALLELVLSRRVRGAVRHDPHARPMTAIAIARCVALGKATALVGAGVVGAALAVVARTAPDAGDITAAAHDLQVAVVLAVVAALVAAAGIVLERAGLDPGRHDRERRARRAEHEDDERWG